MSSLTFITGAKTDLPAEYLEDFLKMLQASRQEQLPFEGYNLDYYRNYWQMPLQSEDDEIQLWAFKDDELIGFGFAFWKIKYDNQHYASIQIYVKPEERRNGYGTRIFHEILQNLPEQITIFSISTLTNTPGEAFLRKYQKDKSFEEIINAVNLSEFNKEEIKSLAEKERERVAKLGYSFIEIFNHDYSEKIDEIAFVQMVEEIWNDMPLEDLSEDREIITPERYRLLLDKLIKRGNDIYGFVVVESATNKPIGLSKILVNKYQPNLAEQEDTGILCKYRGKGLGIAVKYQLLNKMLQELSIKQWITGNALSNVHMIRINNILKHKEIGRIVVYEFPKKDWIKI